MLIILNKNKTIQKKYDITFLCLKLSEIGDKTRALLNKQTMLFAA